MDLSTIIGIVLAGIGIIGGLILEGGNLAQITQPTAFLIVMGGAVGAGMVSFPLPIFMAAMKGFVQVFKPQVLNSDELIEDMVRFATKARKEGIISLEPEAKELKDPFFKKALSMAIDGADPKELKHTLENQLGYIDEHGATIPKVWEAIGGYAPTVGIIGAVMGLIQVMGNLSDIEAVGHGIAVAFVATIYGVGFSNILFLPAAAKLTLLHKKSLILKEMVIEGILLIIEGVNPMIIRDKLSGFIVDKPKGKAEEAKPAAEAPK